jgi:hypothetical protein
MTIIIMSMGWDYVSELRPPTGLLLIPTWHMSMENHGGMISAGENSWFIHQIFLVTLRADSSTSKAGGTGEWILPYEVSLLYLEELICRKKT